MVTNKLENPECQHRKRNKEAKSNTEAKNDKGKMFKLNRTNIVCKVCNIKSKVSITRHALSVKMISKARLSHNISMHFAYQAVG